MTHPNYLGWQVDWPVFVKIPFTGHGKDWKKGEHFNWKGRSISEEAVAKLYSNNNIHHNKALEKQSKVGDRLEEFEGKQLSTLVGLLNAEVKARTNSTTEYNNKKCSISKIDAKQRGLIRTFLRGNLWIEDKFYEIRDQLLGE